LRRTRPRMDALLGASVFHGALLREKGSPNSNDPVGGRDEIRQKHGRRPSADSFANVSACRAGVTHFAKKRLPGAPPGAGGGSRPRPGGSFFLKNGRPSHVFFAPQNPLAKNQKEITAPGPGDTVNGRRFQATFFADAGSRRAPGRRRPADPTPAALPPGAATGPSLSGLPALPAPYLRYAMSVVEGPGASSVEGTARRSRCSAAILFTMRGSSATAPDSPH